MNVNRLPLLVLPLVLSLTACMSGAAPAASPSPTPVAPQPSALPGGGGAPGNAGSGIVLPPDFPISFPGVGNDPNLGAPQLVQPQVGLLDVHPVGATKVDAAVDGRKVLVRISWWSGVEPCHVLAGVDVAKDGTNITLTVNEGSGDPQAICIEIAQLKGAIVDLGELEPGTYTISAGGGGDATPVTVTIA
jgi:hypothetical protein